MSETFSQISVARTVALKTPNPCETDELRWPPKSPATTQDYSFDVTAWADDAGEVLTGFAASVTTPGSTVVPLTCTPQPLVIGSNLCTVILAGGASPTDCCITFVITTPTRTLQLSLWILVVNLSGNLERFRAIAVLGTSIDPGTASAAGGAGQ